MRFCVEKANSLGGTYAPACSRVAPGGCVAERPPPHDPVEDRLVTPERSVFGTRLPRPTGVGRHLIVVLILAMVALVIAIGFAERETSNEPGASAPRAPS